MKNGFRQICYTKSGVVQYMFLYLMYISTNSVFYYYNSSSIHWVMIIVSLLSIIRIKGRSIGLEYIIPLTVLLVGMTLSRWQNGGGYGFDVFLNIASVSCLTYCSYSIDCENAVSRYIRLVYAMAVISIICWIISFISPELLKAVLLGDTNMFNGTKGSFIYSFHYAAWGQGDYRNSGIFSEPGRYQCVLNSAIFFLLFMVKDLRFDQKERKKYLVVCIVALLSTQSTTGYMGLTAMLIGFLLLHRDIMKGKILKVCMVVGIALGADFIIRGTASLVYQTVLSKVFSESGSFDINASTGVYRMNGITTCWMILKDNLLGCGDRYTFLYQSLSGGVESAGAGLFVFAAVTGVISTLGVLMMYLLPAIQRHFSVVQMFVYFFLIINTASAQSDVMYACILCVAVFGSALSEYRGEVDYENRDSNISSCG